MNCPLKHFEACEEKLCAWYDEATKECFVFVIAACLTGIEGFLTFHKEIP